MADDYLVLLSWLLAALGAALLGGTGRALMQYRRTGAFPRQPKTDESGDATQASPRTAVAKCVLGALLLGWGVLSILARGL